MGGTGGHGPGAGAGRTPLPPPHLCICSTSHIFYIYILCIYNISALCAVCVGAQQCARECAGSAQRAPAPNKASQEMCGALVADPLVDRREAPRAKRALRKFRDFECRLACFLVYRYRSLALASRSARGALRAKVFAAARSLNGWNVQTFNICESTATLLAVGMGCANSVSKSH
jgi:hypothetical protein